MKKILLLLLLIPFSLFASNAELWIYFKNRTNVLDFTAESYWTFFLYAHNYYRYFENAADKNISNPDYLCFFDCCCMNPVSRETKRRDYEHLCYAIRNTGNECNYFEDNGVLIDDWCVSFRYDQVDSVFYSPFGGQKMAHICLYDGEKHF